jgi:hypothetical protein
LNIILRVLSGRCDTGWRPWWVVRDRKDIVQEKTKHGPDAPGSGFLCPCIVHELRKHGPDARGSGFRHHFIVSWRWCIAHEQ